MSPNVSKPTEQIIKESKIIPIWELAPKNELL